MKIKVCLECGKHNLETAWSCAGCGHTLSIKNLIDTEDQKALGSHADRPWLINLSSHYHEDAIELLTSSFQFKKGSLPHRSTIALIAIAVFRRSERRNHVHQAVH